MRAPSTQLPFTLTLTRPCPCLPNVMMPYDSEYNPRLRVRDLSVLIGVAFLVLSIVGCHAHDPETEALQAEALALHDSLVVIETQVRDALAQAATEADTLQLATPVLDSLDAIRADLDTWSSYLVEPPGDHDEHDHNHSHDHAPAADVTPQQMVEVQQALLDGIEALQLRLERLNLDAMPATPEGNP